MIKFTIPGEPVAQGRPRASVNKNPNAKRKVTMRDPIKSKNFKIYVGMVALQHRPKQPIESPLFVRIKAFRSIPASWKLEKKVAAASGEIRPESVPDVDNYAKGVKDALNKIIWKDDSQVLDLFVSKYYSNDPRIEVEIYEIGKDEIPYR